jgi:CubicO group peptidase (beta-lactamase class C family)
MRLAMNRKLISVLTFTILLLVTISAQADQVDDLVKAEIKRQRIPGASIAVIKDGKVIKAEGYGLADVEHNVPARPDTVFKIGSVSKQFIATGIMLLVQDGKIGLDDRISKYLEGTPETWQGITIRHLLTHTSGIVREAPGFDPFKIQKDADVIKTAYPLPLRFAPGEKWEYCNVGYFALAEIISRVSGKYWGDFLNERVFAPLGMASTRVTTVSDIIPNRSAGYVIDKDKLQNSVNWPAVRPSGAFLSTALDLAKWEAALCTDKILKPATRVQMWTPVTLNSGKKYLYGLGWELEDFRGIATINHSGSLTGFRARFLRLPAHGLTTIVLTNLGSADVEAIATGIAVRYLPEIDLASFQPKPSPDEEMTRLLKGLLTDYANGAKDIPQVTAELRSLLAGFSQSSRETLARRLKNGGSFDFLAYTDVKDKGIERLGSPVVGLWHYRLVTADRTIYYTFYLTSEGRVAYLEPSAY